MRSSKISLASKPTQQQKVTIGLAELGFGTQLIMPTARTCAKFEHLQNLMATLLELKRQTDKVEHDVRVAKQRKDPNGDWTGALDDTNGPRDGIKRSNSVSSSVSGDKSNKRLKKS